MSSLRCRRSAADLSHHPDPPAQIHVHMPLDDLDVMEVEDDEKFAWIAPSALPSLLEPRQPQGQPPSAAATTRFAEELRTLRVEFAEHNARLLELISQRTAQWVSPGSGIGAMKSDVPQMLKVISPNGPQSCSGAYMVQQGMRPNDFPVWKQVEGPHWLYSMASGRWGIGGEKERSQSFLSDGAYIFCSQQHMGAMPHRMQCAWKRNNPAWTPDNLINVQEMLCGGNSASSCQLNTPAEELVVSPPEKLRMSAWTGTMNEPKRTIHCILEEKDSEFGTQRASELQGRMHGASMQRASLRMSQNTQWTQDVNRNRNASVATVSSTAPHERRRPRNKRPNKRSCMFLNKEEMKEQVQKNILEGPYRVEDKYSETGWAQVVARHVYFEYVTLLLLVLNGLWIGIDADRNPADAMPEAPLLFRVVEHCFCTFFALEITLRFCAFELKRDAFLDFQFVFDLCLVSLMVFETWFIYVFLIFTGDNPLAGAGAVAVLRMLRLTRIARIARLLRAVPELMMLVKGLGAAFKSVAWTLIFLLLVIYIFSVVFRILCKQNSLSDSYFASIPEGMRSLLLPGLLPDSNDHVMAMAEEHWAFAVLFMVFIVVASITVMNMLVGVLVEVVSVVAAVEKEELNCQYVRSELKHLMETHLDLDGNEKLSKEEVEMLLMNPHAGQVISQVGVDVLGLVEIAEFHLFNQKDEIEFSEFLELVLQLRGSQSVSVRDIVNLRKFIMDELCRVQENLVHRVADLDARRAATQPKQTDVLELR